MSTGSSRRTLTQVCEEWAEQWRRNVAEMIDSKFYSWIEWMVEVRGANWQFGREGLVFSWRDSVSPIFSIKCKLGYTGITQLVHSSDRKFYWGSNCQGYCSGSKGKQNGGKSSAFYGSQQAGGLWDDKGSSD